MLVRAKPEFDVTQKSHKKKQVIFVKNILNSLKYLFVIKKVLAYLAKGIGVVFDL